MQLQVPFKVINLIQNPLKSIICSRKKHDFSLAPKNILRALENAYHVNRSLFCCSAHLRDGKPAFPALGRSKERGSRTRLTPFPGKASMFLVASLICPALHTSVSPLICSKFSQMQKPHSLPFPAGKPSSLNIVCT